MKKCIGAAGAISLLCLAGNSVAGSYSAGLGAEYSEGDYGGSSDTSYWYVPLNLGYSSGNLSLSLAIPYISMSGAADTATVGPGGGSGSMPNKLAGALGPTGGTGGTGGTTGATESSESGLGDITLFAGYQLRAESARSPWLGLGAKVKFGTADESRNLGSGENDYALQLGAAKNWLSGYLGYKWLGDTATVDYNDIAYGGVGVKVPVAAWKVGLDYYTEQASLDGVDPAREATLSFGRAVSDSKWLNLYLIKGFSDSSPDWGAGVGISRYF